MKKLIVTLFIATSIFLANAQVKVDTIYLKANFKKTSKKKAEFVRCVSQDSAKFFLVVDYKKTGELYEIGRYADSKFTIPHGKLIRYNSNGKILRELSYDQGRLSGVIKTYYDNGNIKRLENYSNEVLQQGKYYTQDGRDTTLAPFLRLPEYKEGMAALKKHIYDRLNYPFEMRQRSVEGTVILGFVVTARGRIESVKYLRSPNEPFSQEAFRLIMTTDGNWKPGLYDGEPADLAISLPIVFKLE
jgi:periplasmic protein TonB